MAYCCVPTSLRIKRKPPEYCFTRCRRTWSWGKNGLLQSGGIDGPQTAYCATQRFAAGTSTKKILRRQKAKAQEKYRTVRFRWLPPHHLQTKAVQERSLASVNKRARATGALQMDASQAVASLSIFLPSSISIQPMDEEEASMDVSCRPYEPAGHCNAQYCGNKAQRDQSVQLDSRTPSSLPIAKRTK